MKKQLLFLLSVSVLIICSCASHNITHPQAKNTPGAIPVSAELLCDQTEITNFNWIEYLFWLSDAYGKNSIEYTAALPDTSVWDFVACDTTYEKFYLRHPAYRSYPVVGITQEQAVAFSKWRSDRVMEVLLMEKGILRFERITKGTDRFTIEKYFAGEYKMPIIKDGDTTYSQIAPDFSIPYPVYRLPDAEERLLILNYIDSTDFAFHQKKSKKYEVWRSFNVPFLLANEPCIDDSLASSPTRMVDPFLDRRNKFGLIHNSRGNVAEWGAEPNMTYGGGWPHNVEYMLSKDTISAQGSNSWTGFRNVCEWRYWKKD